MAAAYTFDFADREATLAVTSPAGTAPVVTASAYLPAGPLAELTLGNGTSETRSFTPRYFPQAIALAAARDRGYTFMTDSVGNVRSITEAVECLNDVVLENRTVTGTEVHQSCGKITAGPAVTVSAGGALTLRGATSVVLKSGFSVASGASFSAGTDPDLDGSTWTFDYQDVDYFLTSAIGPWGDLAWTYDRIGNRLSETRDGWTDIYAYTLNGTGGNTPRLLEIQLAVGGERTFAHGPAGHLTTVSSSGNVVNFGSDAAGRLSRAERFETSTPFAYDGRSYLAEAGTEAGPEGATRPTYSSNGLLHALAQRVTPSDAGRIHHVFYFAGRPVAQLSVEAGAEIWRYLTTDHLGTPWVATDAAGAELWHGPFEPFGRDRWAGTNLAASEEEVFLRFPGQWDDEAWLEATRGAEVYYNLHRWHQPQTGRYSRTDPLQSSHNDYAYVDNRPTLFVDPLGLIALDPISCGKMGRRRMTDRAFGQDEPIDLGCCYEQLDRAVKRFNEFFSRGWRQRNPDCWRAIDSARLAGWKPRRPGQGILTPLSCMLAGHRGRTMLCESKSVAGAPKGKGCGRTDSAGQTYFRPEICDQQKCLSPLNVLFHESLHSCGAPPDRHSDAAARISARCVGQ